MGVKVGLEDYISRIKDDQRVIFYLAAPRSVSNTTCSRSNIINNILSYLVEH